MGGVLQLTEWLGAGIKIKRMDDKDGDNHNVLIDEVLSKSDERIVLDLHIGSGIQRDSQKWIEAPDPIKLLPGECIRVRAAEKLEVPKGVFGLICSRASLAATGLYVPNIKVDPQFTGGLEIAVYNASRERIMIKRSEPFASLFFIDLRTPMVNDLPRGATQTRLTHPPTWQERLLRVAPFAATAAVSIGGSLMATEIWSLTH